MAGRRLSMRKIKEVLRLKWENRCSNKQIAQSCNMARSSVREYLRRAQEAGLRWPLDPGRDDTGLENLLFPAREVPRSSQPKMPSMEYLFRELKRPGVTLQLLWYEYKQTIPEGYQYSQFCNLYPASGPKGLILASDNSTEQERSSLSTLPDRPCPS